MKGLFFKFLHVTNGPSRMLAGQDTKYFLPTSKAFVTHSDTMSKDRRDDETSRNEEMPRRFLRIVKRLDAHCHPWARIAVTTRSLETRDVQAISPHCQTAPCTFPYIRRSSSCPMLPDCDNKSSFARDRLETITIRNRVSRVASSLVSVKSANILLRRISICTILLAVFYG
jgi:hypothetical protein